MLIIAGIFIGLILSISAYALFILPKRKELDQQTIWKNEALQATNQKLIEEKTKLQESFKESICSLERVKEQIATAQDKLDKYNNFCAEAEERKDQLVKECEERNIMRIQQEQELEKYNEKLQEAQNSYDTCVENFKVQAIIRRREISAEIQKIIDKRDALIERQRKEEEQQANKEFYTIQIGPTAKEEIEIIKTILPRLRNPEVLYKVIWKEFYEKPLNALIARVIEPAQEAGIYQITSITTGRIYVGQSVNLRNRWKDHVKAGLGIGGTNNKLYTAMREEGPQNFMFNILEYCSPKDLNEKEKYWIDYFHSDSVGLNEKKGGARANES